MTEKVVAVALTGPWLLCSAGFYWWATAYRLMGVLR